MAKEEKKKKKIPTAVKRITQSKKTTLRNKQFKSKTKTAIKDFEASVAEKAPAEEQKKKLNLVFSLADKAVKKRIYKKNKASHLKAKYSAYISK